MCPSRLGMSRCHACGLRNSECHVCVRMARAELAVGARSRSALPRGSRTAPGRANGLEENGAGPSGGGGGERGIFKHRGQGQQAWGSGGGGIYRAHTQRAFEREDGASVHLATTEARFMAD